MALFLGRLAKVKLQPEHKHEQQRNYYTSVVYFERPAEFLIFTAPKNGLLFELRS